jgi:hypothetical protein
MQRMYSGPIVDAGLHKQDESASGTAQAADFHRSHAIKECIVSRQMGPANPKVERPCRQRHASPRIALACRPPRISRDLGCFPRELDDVPE